MDNDVKREVNEYENYVKLLNNRNRIGKHKFIKEMNAGLGEDIKAELISKKPNTNKVKEFFRKLFKIF